MKTAQKQTGITLMIITKKDEDRHMTNIPLPTYWSPAQALAVYELLDDIRTQIWRIYSEELIEEEMQTQENCTRQSFGVHDIDGISF
jgi:hypothetical protein